MSISSRSAIRYSSFTSDIGQVFVDKVLASLPAEMLGTLGYHPDIGLMFDENYIIETTLGSSFRTDLSGEEFFDWIVIDDSLLWGGHVLRPDQVIKVLFGNNLSTNQDGRTGWETTFVTSGTGEETELSYRATGKGDYAMTDTHLLTTARDMDPTAMGYHDTAAGDGMISGTELYGMNTGDDASYDTMAMFAHGGFGSALGPGEARTAMNIINGMLSTAFFGTSIICSPPLIVKQSMIDAGHKDIFGFFSSACPFQMTHKWEVYVDMSNAYGIVSFIAGLMSAIGGHATEMIDTGVPAGHEAVTALFGDFSGADIWAELTHGNDGIMHHGALNSNQGVTGTWTKMQNRDRADEGQFSPSEADYHKSWNNASNPAHGATFAFEAMGIDYFDTRVQGVQQANEFLHSSELFEVNEGGCQFQPFGGSLSISGDKAFIGLHPQPYHPTTIDEGTALLQARAQIQYTALDNNSMFTRGYRTRWNGTPDNPSLHPLGIDIKTLMEAQGSSFQLEPWQSWVGTHAWERQASLQATQKQCTYIMDEYTTIDIPKKLINKVQRRKRIPDYLVSAFGHITPDGADYSTGRATSDWMATVAGARVGDHSADEAWWDTSPGEAGLYGEAEGGSWGGMTWDEYVASKSDIDVTTVDMSDFYDAVTT